jgi:hypothetical protein
MSDDAPPMSTTNHANSMHQSTSPPVRPPAESLAVLTREVRIRLLNCSLAGCLLEADVPLPVGTVAALTLRIGDHEFTDGVRVVRCQAIAGAGSLHHIGAELLWTAAPGHRSLRAAMQQRLGSQQDAGAMY